MTRPRKRAQPAKQKRWASLRDRSTTDLLVLLIAGTICASVFMYGIAVTVLVFVQPEKNHGPAVALLSNTMQMLIGLLAGFIAGRTDATIRSAKKDTDAGEDHG